MICMSLHAFCCWLFQLWRLWSSSSPQAQPHARQAQPPNHHNLFSYAFVPRMKRSYEGSQLKDDQNLEYGTHPIGIQPLGNLLVHGRGASFSGCRNAGLGSLCVVPDECLVLILYHLGVKGLVACSLTSRAFYGFHHYDDFWRNHVLSQTQGDFTFTLTWKRTLCCWLQLQRQKKILGDKSEQFYIEQIFKQPPPKPVRVEDLFSDVLFKPWMCASVGIKPSWLSVENVARRRCLSVEEFIDQYEKPNLPVLITDVVPTWKAFGKWSKEFFLSQFGDTEFAAGAANMTFKNYSAYSEQVRETERPLYLFDKHFLAKCPELVGDFENPHYFHEDLFGVLGPEKRPDHQWLIIGPKKSGSAFHIDPNGTSAWNAVITGRKKWILYPPDKVPPGVMANLEQGVVSSPISLTEWFLDFYDRLKKNSGKRRNPAGEKEEGHGEGPYECVCEAGEMLFVPAGWWHMVVNLEDSIAITQNFVSSQNLPRVLDFLKTKPDQVSGVPQKDRASLYNRFVSACEGKLGKENVQAIIASLTPPKRVKSLMVDWSTLSSASSALRPSTSDSAKGEGMCQHSDCRSGDSPVATVPATGGEFSFGFQFD